MGDGKISGLMCDIINKVHEISGISNYVFSIRKPFLCLARRLDILIPFFEEIRDNKNQVSSSLYYALMSLLINLETTRKLLWHASKGSKVYLVLERKQIMREYEAVAALLEKDLMKIYDEKHHEISYEVKEHAAVVLSQFKRAKGNTYQSDEVYEDLFALYDKGTDGVVDPVILRRLVETLELTEAMDIENESKALNEMLTNCGGNQGQSILKMLRVVNLIKDFVQRGNQSLDVNPLVNISARQGTIETSYHDKDIPYEFMCPISLQLMQDPVIISSGQTYERTSIERWMEAGNGTCPKTRQILATTTLTPNYALRSLIRQWCEKNGTMNPQKAESTTSCCSPPEYSLINKYIQHLKSDHNPHQLRTGAGEICLMSRRNSAARIAIGEAGAIPLLSKLLLKTRDPLVQEYAMRALLNLSICDENKEVMISLGAIPDIIEAMKVGSLEACEHGAAILFSLAVNDDVKNTIGSCGGIKPLVWLLAKGTERGRKDAVTALFNLCLFRDNKARAVKEGIVFELMIHIREPQGRMQDEALMLLDLIKSHRAATQALDAEDPVLHLVNAIWMGSQMNQEHASSVLLHLCSRDTKHLEKAKGLGVKQYLMDLNLYGSDKGKQNARQLLEIINTNSTDQRKRARTE